MENKSGLSIAVMLSVIGLVGLTLGTSVGFVLDSYPVAEALAFGAAVFIVGGVGLYLAVKAKTVDNEFAKWRKYEMLGLVLCVAVVAFAAQPTIYAANFIIANRALRDAGERDINTVRGMITTFKAKESDRLSLTREGLENYMAFRPQSVDSRLKHFILFEVMHNHAGSLNSHVINEYVVEKSYIIEHGSLQDDLFRRYDNELTTISNRLSNFDIADFPGMATELTALSDSVGANLTALSSNMNFGNIGVDELGTYYYSPISGDRYMDRAEAFGREYASMFAPRLGSLAILIAFVLLFIFDYLMEFRSLRVPAWNGPKISDRDGLPL